MADTLHEPLFNTNAVERELNSIESEYKMNSHDTGVRVQQILQNTTTHPDHIYNRFTWGNNKSLLPADKGNSKHEIDALVADLQKFFHEQYSADRMKLVVLVKADDNQI